jgi:hypothetical protein
VVHLRLSDVTRSPDEAKGRSLVEALWRDIPNRRALILACGLQVRCEFGCANRCSDTIKVLPTSDRLQRATRSASAGFARD